MTKTIHPVAKNPLNGVGMPRAQETEMLGVPHISKLLIKLNND